MVICTSCGSQNKAEAGNRKKSFFLLFQSSSTRINIRILLEPHAITQVLHAFQSQNLLMLQPPQPHAARPSTPELAQPELVRCEYMDSIVA